MGKAKVCKIVHNLCVYPHKLILTILVTSEGSFGLETKRFINWLRSQVSLEWKSTPFLLEINMLNITILRSQTKLLTTHFSLVSILVMQKTSSPHIIVWLFPRRTLTMGLTVLCLTREVGGMKAVIILVSTVTMEVTITNGTWNSREARWNWNPNLPDK